MVGRCREGSREMKVKKLRQIAFDRKEWAFVIKKAEALTGP
jgi:hypothetical protein